jgi:hypothetical protein
MNEPLPPPCPPPLKFVHVTAKRFPTEQALAAGEALLNRRQLGQRGKDCPQPISRPNAVAALTPAEEAQFAAFEVELGGRLQLAALLAAADLPERDQRLAALLVDPANDGTSLAKLCAWSRISLRRLLDFVKDAALVKGQIKALVAVGERLPDVAVGLMTDAIPGDRTCPVCKGLRQLLDDPTPQEPSPVPRICKTCDGTGTVPYHPETELRKVALQIGKLLDKPGNTNNVYVAQKFGAGTVQPFSQVVGELDGVLDAHLRDRFGRRVTPPIEGEATDGSIQSGDRPPDAPDGPDAA